DIIMVGRRISEDEIELPHPRAHERAFVLVPWLDADPLAELAGHGPVKGLVDSMDTTGVKRRDDIVVTKPERV
ncbi:2-amino-4-hydroxy-6-hydroxymethyldihydropteridine diphosphokinase, partial [Guyparkeria sp. 1SP6A2]|nr:2-amino-4-hydroxy-6-hydroxymethyldihydropteridine diphosphokinase [Guyparkeria sp. 1SP6A2]